MQHQWIPSSSVSLPLFPLFLTLSIMLGNYGALGHIAPVDIQLRPDSFNIDGDGLACEIAKCLRGTCVNTTFFPFYRCECDAGWKTPFASPWLPCIVPNCTFDFSCANTTKSHSSPPPPQPLFGNSEVCSLAVCGNGDCVPDAVAFNGSNLFGYECKCHEGFVNFGDRKDGYCIHKCSLGADCTNLSFPIGGGVISSSTSSSPSTPITQTSNEESNQGTPPSFNTTIATSVATNEGQTYIFKKEFLIIAFILVMSLVFGPLM